MDAVTLFTYLKLEQYIPLHVFCSVELNCTTNMAVMNATIMRRARARELQDAAARSRPIGVYSGLSERRRSSLRSLNDEGMVSRKNSVFGHHSDNGEDHEPVNMWESFLQVLTSCSDKIIGRLGDDDGKESSDIPPPPNSDAPGGGSSPMGTPILGSPILGSPKSLLSRKRLAENTPSPAPPQSVVAMVPVGGVSNSGRRKSAFGSLGIDDFSLLTHTSAAKEANSSNERHNGRHSASPTPGQQGSIGSALELRSSRRNSLSHPDEGADHGKLQRSSSQRVPSVDLGASFYSKFLFAFRFCGLDKERMRSRSASDDNRASVSAGLLPVGANAKHHKENKLWDALTTHHMLPVFAAAKAFVPTSFESLLVQSFYLSLTPVICEKLVCGQVDQIIIQIALPAVMDGHPFVSLFRLFMNYKVLCLGLYRSANDLESGALLPYVFLGPLGGTVLRAQDRVFLYGTVKDTDNAIKYITNKLSTPPESHYDR